MSCENTTSEQAISTTAPLYVRTVAGALQRHMDKHEDSRIHWAQPAGDEVSWGPAKLVWPSIDDSFLTVIVSQGSNEGYLVTLCDDAQLKGPEFLKPLMVVKCLCSYLEAFNQARLIMEFIKKLDVDALLTDQKKFG